MVFNTKRRGVKKPEAPPASDSKRKTPPKKNRYHLRSKSKITDDDVVWVDEDESDEESDDEEDEDYEEESEEEETRVQGITVPSNIPVSVKIHLHTFVGTEEEDEDGGGGEIAGVGGDGQPLPTKASSAKDIAPAVHIAYKDPKASKRAAKGEGEKQPPSKRPKNMDSTMLAGRLHHGPRPICTFKKPAAYAPTPMKSEWPKFSRPVRPDMKSQLTAQMPYIAATVSTPTR